jgi:N-acetylneuraminic acid mutarotase
MILKIKRPIILYYFSFILLFLSCNEPAKSPYPDISFVKRSTMSLTGRASAVAFVIDNKAYVTLGRTQNAADSLKESWQYDPLLDKWTDINAPFPGVARVKAMAAVINDTAYVGLGFARNAGAYTGGCLKDFWRFDSKTNAWFRMKDIPTEATNACVSFVYNGFVYVGAGFDNFGFNNELWKFNPKTNTWTLLSGCSFIPRAGAVLCANAAHVYFGTGYRVVNENDWWEYFPANDSWERKKKMPDTGRENAVALCINDRFFVSTGRNFGGNLTGGHVKSDIMEFDSKLNVWYCRGNIPAPERENAIAFTINGKGYIGFGDNDAEILNDLWCFEP